ncbi:MAG: hypothetical protein COB09_08330 [Thalassobium sp.]|nr:MAG: hypothetical protein COB09_08330 [Thalassobium sp.]
MNMKEISTEFFDNSIRAELIVNIPSMLSDEDSPPDIIADNVYDDLDRTCAAMGIKPPSIHDIDDLGFWFSDLARRKGFNGFLVQFATPIPTNIRQDGGFSFSWGYYTTQWIYGDTYEEACAKAVEWAAGFVSEKRAAAGVSAK